MSCVELNSVTWICSLLSYSLNAQPKTLTMLGKQRYITQVTSIPCLSSAVDTLTLPSPDSGHHTDHVKVFRGGFPSSFLDSPTLFSSQSGVTKK